METGVIGRVSVRVFPDTSDFRRKLKADLEKQRGLKVEIPVEPNDDGAARELKLINEKLQREAKPIEIKVDIDKDHLRDFDKRLRDQLKELTVKIDFDYKAQLKEAEARIDEGLRDRDVDVKIDAEKLNLDDLEVDVDLNYEEALRELKERTDDLDVVLDVELDKVDERRLKSELDELHRSFEKLNDKIHVSLDPAEYAQATDRLEKLQKLTKDLKLKIFTTLDPDAREATEQQLHRLQNEYEEIKAAVEVSLDPESYEKSKHDLDDIKDKLEAIEGKWQAKVQVDLNNLSTLNVRRTLATLARDRFVKFIPTVSKAALAKVAAAFASLSGAMGAKGALDDIRNLIDSFVKNAPKFASIGTALAGLVTSLLAGAGDALSLSHSLGQVFKLGLAAPAVIGGMTTALIATVLAFKDMNKVLPGVVKRFKNLQKTISKNFWAQAAAPIKELANTVLPLMDKGLAKVSTSLGNFFGALAKGLQQKLAPDLPAMFDNLARAIDKSKGGASALAGIIGTLGKTGSKFLPALGESFTKVTQRFEKFLDKADKDGKLEEWIQEGVDALKDLGSIAGSTFKIMEGLGKAAKNAGGSTLSTFANTMKRIADVVQSPAFQKGLTSFFKGLEGFQEKFSANAGKGLKDFFESVGKNAQTILPKVGDAFGKLVSSVGELLSNQGLSDGIGSFLDSFSKALDTLQPYLDPIGKGLGVLVDLFGRLGGNAVEALAPLLGAIGDGLAKAQPGLDSLADGLGDFLKSFSKGASKGLEDFVASLGPLADSLSKLDWAKLGEAFGKLATAILDISVDVIEGMADAFVQMANDGTIDQIADALGTFSDVLQWFVDNKQVSGFLQSLGFALVALAPAEALFGIGSIGDALKGLGGDIEDLASKVPGWLSSVKDAIVNGFNGAKDWLTDKGSALVNGFRYGISQAKKGAVSEAAKIKSAIADKYSDAKKWLLGKGSDLVNGLKQGISRVKKDAISEAAKIKSAIRDKYSNAKTWLTNKGSDLVHGLRSGIVKNAQNITTAAQNLKDRARTAFNNAATWLASKGRALVNGLRDGIRGAASRVTSAAGHLLGAARDGLGNAAGALWNAGSRVVDGFVSGIRNAFYKVRSVLSNLTSLLPDWKGPASKDSVILKGAGQLVIDGFIDGLESRYKAVKDSLTGLTDDVRKTVTGGFGLDGSTSTVKVKSLNQVGRKVSASMVAPAAQAATGGETAGRGVTVNQTIINPTVESDAEALNKGLQTAGLFGLA